jgi:hypothetical protein
VVAVAAGAYFAGVTERVLNLRTIAARGELWQAGIDAWLAHPLTGLGPGSFPWVLQLTNYFDTNSWAPRHPDSAVIQLLAEVGLVGVFGVAGVVISLIGRMWQSKLASWALLCFGICSVAANPTDFGFLVAIAIAWAAFATPFTEQTSRRQNSGRRRLQHGSVAWVTVIALLPITAAMVFAALAESAYQAAGSAVASSNLEEAEDSLRTATDLDPQMALYHRALGLVEWARSGPRESLNELQKAVEANGSDDFAFRSLASAERAAGDTAAATRAVESAVMLQRSDTNNTLLAGELYAADDRSDAALEIVAETVQANPTLVLAPNWRQFVAGLNLDHNQVVLTALERWANKMPSPQPVTVQGLWLTALAGRNDLAVRAEREAPFPAELAAAVKAALNCQNGKAEQAIATDPTPRESYYWLIRIRVARQMGFVDNDAYTILRILTGSQRGTVEPVDVLSENTTPGFSLDAWGYRRASILIRGLAGSLPSPGAGLANWLEGGSRPASCDSV